MITDFSRLLCSFFILTTMASASSLKDNPQVADMAAANTKLMLNLLRECGGGDMENKNVFLGPYSISTALAMTYMGARGATADEMKKVLKWSSPKAPTEGFSSYLNLLKKSSDAKNTGYILVGSQRVYVSDKMPMQKEFSESTKEHFTSDAKNANFEGNADGERKLINAWVNDETRGKISDLLPEGSITPLTAMVLVQAMYFKGSWVHKFDAEDTTPDDFFAPGGKITVSMMRQTRNFNHGIFPEINCAAIELPYASNDPKDGGHDLSMLILLPDAQDGIANLERDLTFDRLTNIRKNLSSKKVELRLPKFKVESSFALKEVLSELGMPLAFSNKADFSGMVTGEGSDSLYISQVFHKAVVEVNEEGSEAAAATAVTIMKRSIPIIHPFIAKHPFLFFIMDKRANVVLFNGRVATPPSTSGGAPKVEL